MKNTLFRFLSIVGLVALLSGCCRDRGSCSPCGPTKKKMVCNPCDTVCPPVKTCEDRIEPVFRKIRRCVEVTEQPQGLVCYDPETGEELDHVKMQEGMENMPMQKKGGRMSNRRNKMMMDDDNMEPMAKRKQY